MVVVTKWVVMVQLGWLSVKTDAAWVEWSGEC
jgi:hypothetical protein